MRTRRSWWYMLSILVVAAAATADTNATLRTWTSISGQTVEATFVRLQPGYAVLRTAEGKELQIGLSRLAASDRKLAQELGRPARPKPAAAPSPAGTYAGTYRFESWKQKLDCVLSEDGKGGLTAAWTAMHSDGKEYKYNGTLAPVDDGKYDGLFDVRRPKEFRVTGSFSGNRFSATITLVDRNGRGDKTGSLTMSRKDRS